jgi:hypothetical protein
MACPSTARGKMQCLAGTHRVGCLLLLARRCRPTPGDSAGVADQRLYPCDCHAASDALISASGQCQWPVTTLRPPVLAARFAAEPAWRPWAVLAAAAGIAAVVFIAAFGAAGGPGGLAGLWERKVSQEAVSYDDGLLPGAVGSARSADGQQLRGQHYPGRDQGGAVPGQAASLDQRNPVTREHLRPVVRAERIRLVG